MSSSGKKCILQNSVQTECPDDLKDKSARSTCEQINADATWAVANQGAGKDWFTNVLDSLGSRSTSLQNAVNLLRIKMKTMTDAKQISSCEQQSSQTQLNLVEAEGIPPECLDGLPPEIQERLINNSYISNVTQSNVAESLNTCKINAALQALSEMNASIDNLTIQEALNKAKGAMSGSTSNQLTCNEIPIEMTACKYITQSQCCSNEVNQSQQNIVRSKSGCSSYITNIRQTNNANAVTDCMIETTASVTDKFDGKIKQTTTQAADNSSEGLTFDFLIILFAIFIFCVLAGAFVSYKYFEFKIIMIIFIIGGIFLLASIICLAIYFSTKKSSTTRYNQPYTSCPTVRTFKSESQKSTLGEVKKRVERKDVIGYDFFIDKDTEKSTDEIARNASNDTKGSVIYITIEPKASDTCDFEDPQKLENAIISYIRGKSNDTLLWIGIVLLIVSVACIGFGSYKLYRNSNPLSNILANRFIPKSSIPITSTNPVPNSSIPITSTNPVLEKTKTFGK